MHTIAEFPGGKHAPSSNGMVENLEILNALGEHIAVIDLNGTIVAVNASWRRFATENGCDAERVSVGVDYLAACRNPMGAPLPEAAEFLSRLKALLAGDISGFFIEYPCHGPNGERWFHMEATSLPAGKGAVLCHRNITERHKAEAGELEARALFSALFYGTGEPMFLCDSQARVQLVNSAFANLFGTQAAKLVGRKIKHLRNKTIGRILSERNTAVEATGVTQIFEITEKSDVGSRTFEVTKGGYRKEVGSARVIWGTVRDISEARAAERKIVDLSDHERQRLAALVHEGPCQAVTGIWLYANALFEDLMRSELPQSKDAREIADLAKEASVEIKQVLKDFLMVPIDVDDGEGFLAALEYLADQVETSGSTKCRLSVPESVEFADPSISRHLFWIAQEAVRNATKHSKATRLQIRLSNNRRNLILTVRDNGIGFTPKPLTSSGIGLQVMQFRVRAIGATLEFRKLKPRGTAVVCTLPRK